MTGLITLQNPGNLFGNTTYSVLYARMDEWSAVSDTCKKKSGSLLIRVGVLEMK